MSTNVSKVLLRRACLHSLAVSHDSIADAVAALGFVQADPIRAPARAQDLILRHRVTNYKVNDLERAYPALDNVEEEFFVNYGFVSREHQKALHPRTLKVSGTAASGRLRAQVLNFVDRNGPTHPKALIAHFGALPTSNAWGGTSQTTTRMLDELHRRGQLRVARREGGIKVYDSVKHLKERPKRLLAEQSKAVLDWILNLYEPLPIKSLLQLVRLSAYGAPQLATLLPKTLATAMKDALHIETCEGVRYVWRRDPNLSAAQWCEARALTPSRNNQVRLLAPFDPVVWDRTRFEHLHGWRYTFEAYVPANKRTRGYYALPLLWRDACVGWANLSMHNETLLCDVSYISNPSTNRFKDALSRECDRMRIFLGAKTLKVVSV
jgi:uncharacterized protein